ncbi:unnamed protein product [Chondrus crispus]|uniref:Uncharacterized protein n=1 Tax=Chondrus crispus TaxID=2769 RepID=S0F3K0_CHOCR|nr:unnamed protein product [Chondrus crispus]CDF77469.1 unnamed protein product [Chondrus crispus]|eukprot:XP_005712343.1 unnamed protein product [Chondrus crispus]
MAMASLLRKQRAPDCDSRELQPLVSYLPNTLTPMYLSKRTQTPFSLTLSTLDFRTSRVTCTVERRDEFPYTGISPQIVFRLLILCESTLPRPLTLLPRKENKILAATTTAQTDITELKDNQKNGNSLQHMGLLQREIERLASFIYQCSLSCKETWQTQTMWLTKPGL